MDHGADAHLTRLDRDEQLGAAQPVIVLTPGGLAERDDLGVRGGIVRADRLIEPAADHRAVEHDDRADGHFPAPPRFTGQLERSAHELLIHTAASYVRWPPARRHWRCSNSLFYHAADREQLGLVSSAAGH